jgi:cell division protein FtsL
MPAVRHEIHERRPTRAHLRVVKNAPRSAARKSVSARRSGVFQAYVFFTTAVIVIALAGAGRVWLTVQAAEASVESARIAKEIKIARYRGDMLEIRESALTAPSRVQALAGTAMGMAPVEGVGYLDLTKKSAASVQQAPTGKRADSGGLKSMLASAMNLAAGEAQVMLVGDVGLASAK